MTTPTCPECAGPQMPNHPAGLLAMKHSFTCSLRAAEDGRAVADHDAFVPTERPATATERILLAAVGAPTSVTADPDLLTSVDFVTDSVIRRTWPWTPNTEETP